MIRSLWWYWLERVRPQGYGHRHWWFRCRTCARCQEVRYQ